MVEFFILSVVVIDHVYFAEIELGEFCAFVMFVETAEALPFQVYFLDVLRKGH